MQDISHFITITFDIKGYLERNPAATSVQIPFPFPTFPQIATQNITQNTTQTTSFPLPPSDPSSPQITHLIPLPIPNDDPYIPSKIPPKKRRHGVLDSISLVESVDKVSTPIFHPHHQVSSPSTSSLLDPATKKDVHPDFLDSAEFEEEQTHELNNSSFSLLSSDEEEEGLLLTASTQNNNKDCETTPDGFDPLLNQHPSLTPTKKRGKAGK